MSLIPDTQIQLGQTYVQRLTSWEAALQTGSGAAVLEEFEAERIAIEKLRNELAEAKDQSEPAADLCGDLLAAAPTLWMSVLSPEEIERQVNDGLETARRKSDKRKTGILLLMLGISARERQQLQDAISITSESWCELEEAKCHATIPGCLLNLGSTTALKGDTRQAAEYLDDARTRFSKFNNQYGIMAAIGAMAHVRRAEKRYAHAITLSENYLERARCFEQRQHEALALGQLASSHRRLGNLDKAEEYYRAQIELGKNLNNLGFQQRALGNLGNLYFDRGDLTSALLFHNQSLQFSQLAGNRRAEAIDRVNLSQIHIEENNHQDAVEQLSQAIEFFRRTGEQLSLSTCLNNLSLSLADLGRTTQAIEAAEEALTIRQRTGDPNIADLGRNLQEWRSVSSTIETDHGFTLDDDGISWDQVRLVYLLDMEGQKFARVYQKISGGTFNEWWVNPSGSTQFMGMNEPADIGERLDVSGVDARQAVISFLS